MRRLCAWFDRLWHRNVEETEAVACIVYGEDGGVDVIAGPEWHPSREQVDATLRHLARRMMSAAARGEVDAFLHVAERMTAGVAVVTPRQDVAH